ncbi:hypothetical protein NQ314_009371 [Rhamnusium bicolor]|uniref:DDE Tnp4 domain-containing protein n=1 Tax=Rhamnusium bicolor TaxID=1586634 RepID=A0AAV8Y0W3_9CUCU|nr:hypothetical protein NQ314_009371 [Rhamnusium bicolor]
MFQRNLFDLPPNKCLPGQAEKIPCVLIGDGAFTLSPYLMRPFPYKQSRYDARKENFNYRLCRAGRVEENSFGIMAHKWRFLFKPLEVNAETAKIIIMAECVLYNFLRTKNIDTQYQHLLQNEEILSIQALDNVPMTRRRATKYAFQIQQQICRLF